jgi:hypothetical protein
MLAKQVAQECGPCPRTAVVVRRKVLQKDERGFWDFKGEQSLRVGHDLVNSWNATII